MNPGGAPGPTGAQSHEKKQVGTRLNADALVVDELLDLETAQGYLSLRAKLMAEVTCSVLARSKSKGISWTTSQGGGDALQPEAVDSLMSVLKAEVQKDLLFSELQVLDLRTAGRGRS
eukprot:4684825-Pyramimonas_sp.AAC.1